VCGKLLHLHAIDETKHCAAIIRAVS